MVHRELNGDGFIVTAFFISFGEPQPADDSGVTDEGVVIRLREGKIVGLTILNAAERVYSQATG